MLKNITATICVLIILGLTPAYALNHINSHVPNAQKVGESRFSVMLWDVYDASLYAPSGSWQADKPFALQLSYLRPLEGKKIADRSIEEMRGQGVTDEAKLATWQTQMRQIFPNVDKGISLTGIRTKTGETVFYQDSVEIGRVTDPDFSIAFFNIWLSDKTSAPDLRRALLGAI